MTYTEKNFNIATGEQTTRLYSTKEIAEVKKAIADFEEKAQKDAIKAIEKTALLEKIGITEDEAKLLLS